MAVHIFQVNEENYQICVQRGLVAISESSSRNVFNGLLSRMACIKDDDYILMYVTKAKELRGVWRADGEPFYEESSIWPEKCYPFRCKIKSSEYNFRNSLSYYDIKDLENTGKIWTWAPVRANRTPNSMFSISDAEFDTLLKEFLKINPFSADRSFIPEPYPFRKNNIMEKIDFENGYPKYEYTIMTLLNHAFCKGELKEQFGNYTDFFSYVPTSLNREMDIMLMFGNPKNRHSIMSYDIIEVKKDKFDLKALSQLIDYESWFLQKKVSGDLKMLRSSAIAKSFSDEVVDYVEKRSRLENKPIKLFQYIPDGDKGILLSRVN